jgi:hypothetical protein
MHAAVHALAQPRAQSQALVRELERMRWHVAQIDQDFDSLVVFFRRQTPLGIEIGTGAHAKDAFELEDETVVVQTNWLVSARESFRRRLGDDLLPWVYEHDDPRGVPCVRAAQLETLLGAASYQEALYLLGDEVIWLHVPDSLAETRTDDD